MAKKKKRKEEDDFIPPPDGFPDHVRIFSQIWTIKYVPHVVKGEHLLGSCEPLAREILIDIEQSVESMKETLLHEIWHACLNILPGGLDEEFEEQLVQLCTATMIDICRSNEPFWYLEDE